MGFSEVNRIGKLSARVPKNIFNSPALKKRTGQRQYNGDDTYSTLITVYDEPNGDNAKNRAILLKYSMEYPDLTCNSYGRTVYAYFVTRDNSNFIVRNNIIKTTLNPNPDNDIQAGKTGKSILLYLSPEEVNVRLSLAKLQDIKGGPVKWSAEAMWIEGN